MREYKLSKKKIISSLDMRNLTVQLTKRFSRYIWKYWA